MDYSNDLAEIRKKWITDQKSRLYCGPCVLYPDLYLESIINPLEHFELIMLFE